MLVRLRCIQYYVLRVHFLCIIAPEVLTQKGYGSAIDMWAVG
jgi:serine/threonine protein kinase